MGHPLEGPLKKQALQVVLNSTMWSQLGIVDLRLPLRGRDEVQAVFRGINVQHELMRRPAEGPLHSKFWISFVDLV
jgi:hypothetical protein